MVLRELGVCPAPTKIERERNKKVKTVVQAFSFFFSFASTCPSIEEYATEGTMSTPEEKIAVTRQYFQLSNEHDLDKIFALFEHDATYHSATATFSGLAAIKTMMEQYFTVTVPDVHWEVDKDFSIDSTFSENSKQAGDAVVCEFLRQSQKNDQLGNRRGREWVLVNEKGKIYHIRVQNLD